MLDLRSVIHNLQAIAAASGGTELLRAITYHLAASGALSERLDGDDNREKTLNRIVGGQIAYARDAVHKRNEALSAVDNVEKRFNIPEHWSWLRLGQLGDWGSGSTPDRKTASYYGGTTDWFKSGELNDSVLLEHSDEQVTSKALSDCSLRLCAPGDVLVAMYGATIGKVAILQYQATTNQAVCACTCYAGMFNQYLRICLLAYRSYFIGLGAGGAQPNISRKKIVQTPVGLPSIQEQARIVKRVQEISSAIDEYEIALIESERIGEELVDRITAALGRSVIARY